MRQLFLPEKQIRITLLQVNCEFQSIQHFDVVPALSCRFAQSPCAIALRAARKNGKFHRMFSVDFTHGFSGGFLFFLRLGLPP